jgi:hypothetical protein
MKHLRAPIITVAVTAFILALYPPIFLFRMKGISSCFSFFAGDAFYYFTIAKHTSWTPLFSFDSLTPTNGFHPLWQFYLKGCFSTINSLKNNQTQQLLLAYWTGAICIGIAAVLLSISVFKLTRKASLALISVVPGLLYFPLALADQKFGSLWSYINGMESAFSLLLFACLITFIMRSRVYVSNSLKTYTFTSLLVSLLILARLDDVFLIPALCVPLLWIKVSFRRKLTIAGILAGVPTLVLVGYCAFNFFYAGTPLPVSGQVKGEVAWGLNMSTLTAVIFPMTTLSNPMTWRALYNFIPAAISIIFIFTVGRRLYFIRRPPGNTVSLFSALSFYVLYKAIYNFVYVRFGHQGHWYYPISTYIGNILLAVWLARTFRMQGLNFRLNVPRHSRYKQTIYSVLGGAISLLLLICTIMLVMGRSSHPFMGGYSLRRVILMAITCSGAIYLLIFVLRLLRGQKEQVRIPVCFMISVLLVLYAANTMMAEKLNSQPHDNLYRFWQNRQTINQQIRQRYNGTGIIEHSDGIIAYSLNIPTMCNLGFTLDFPAMQARQSGNFFDLAYKRGFRWLASMNCLSFFPATLGQDVTKIISKTYAFPDLKIEKWVFRIVYIEPTSGCRFIAFEPRASHTIKDSTISSKSAPLDDQ